MAAGESLPGYVGMCKDIIAVLPVLFLRLSIWLTWVTLALAAITANNEGCRQSVCCIEQQL
jgi:hypothetical protein